MGEAACIFNQFLVNFVNFCSNQFLVNFINCSSKQKLFDLVMIASNIALLICSYVLTYISMRTAYVLA